MPSKTLKSKSAEKLKRCEYLKGEYKLSTLKRACVALNIKVEDGDTADVLCEKIKTERPDLMRGKLWNFFILLLSDLDQRILQTKLYDEKSLDALILKIIGVLSMPRFWYLHTIRGIYKHYLWAQVVHNNEQNDLFPQTEMFLKRVKERNLAHKELGHDPRTKKRFGSFI
jgi:hypothetical protein